MEFMREGTEMNRKQMVRETIEHRFLRLLGAAVLFVITIMLSSVIAHAATEIRSPSDNAEFEAGKSVTIKAKGDYKKPDGFGLLSFPKNYLYFKITHDGKRVDYGSAAYDSFSLLPEEYSFTPVEEGEYLIEVCRDLTYVDKEHVDLAYEDFVPETRIRIRVWKSIEGAEISGIADKVYTGSPLTQTPTLVLGEKTLDAETDYDISYSNNLNVGTATVTFTGKGFYKKTASRTFAITPADITKASVNGIVNREYTGSELTQAPTVTFGDKELTEGTDYEISYENHINAGTASVVFTGKGNFGETLRKTFQITPASLANASVSGISDKLYTGSPITQNPKITYNGSTLVKDTDYTLSYQNNTALGTATVIITGKGNYKDSVTRTFSIRESTQSDSSELQIIEEDTTTRRTEFSVGETFRITGYTGLFVYNNSEPERNFFYWRISKDGQKIDYGAFAFTSPRWQLLKTYTPPAAGDYLVELQLSRSNVLQTEAQFSPTSSVIVHVGAGKTDLSSASVTGISNKPYTGNAVTQSPTVKLGSRTLVNGTDYYVTYSANVSVGSVTMTIRGKGSYFGTITKTFNITPKTLSADMITLSPASFTYNGTVQNPEVTVKNGVILLVQGRDYTLVNEGGTDPGTYKVAISAASNGNYTGTAEKSWTIGKIPIARAAVNLAAVSFIYDGEAKEPAVTSVVLNEAALPADVYTVGYTNHVNAGTATVTVTAAEESFYTGSASATFVIEKCPIDAADITVSAITDTVYSGIAQTPVPEVSFRGTALRNNTDFTLAYSNNKNAGNATVTITGKGNFSGSRTTGFVIARKGISDASVTVNPIPYQEFVEGTPAAPPVTVKDGSTVLTADDYEVSFAENDKPGTATVTITGKGNYTGSRSDVTFEILDPRTFAEARLSDRIAEIEAAGMNDYAAADRTVLEETIRNARALLANSSASIQELEAALSAINSAKAAADENLRIAREREEAERKKAQKAAEEAKKKAQKAAEEAKKKAEKEAAAFPSAAAVEKAVLAQTSDKDPAGSSFAPLMLRSTKQTKKSNKLVWNRVPGVAKYVIYGSRCGKNNRIQKIADVTGTSWTYKKLKKGTYYKYVVVAVRQTVLGERAAAVSKMIHVSTKGGSAGNPKSISVKKSILKKAKALKKGNTLKLKAKIKTGSQKVKKHVAIRYESSNKKIADVSPKGIVRGIAKGTCDIYVYAQNGTFKKIEVIVS